MSNRKFDVGIDWAQNEHAVCLVDSAGAVKTRFVTPHTSEGLRNLRARLARVADASELPVAIERPSGLLVDTLVEAGHPVVPIHPNVVKACRSRYRSSGAKSDADDAYLLADLLRTDGHRFRALCRDSDALRALRTEVRARDALLKQRVAVTNQLRATLERFWPGAAVIFADLDSLIALDFLERYPTPESSRHLGPKRMASFLARHGYSGRRTPDALLARLRDAPLGQAGEIEGASSGKIVLAYVAVLRQLVTQIKQITSDIERNVAQLPKGRILMSFPRAGRVNAAQILAELGDDPRRFVSREHLAAEAGVAPVTRASGKHRRVVIRYACNKRLRHALTTWAGNSRHASPWAASIYDAARARGCRHAHALRILARAWLPVLWRCMQDGTHYEPSRHGAARALEAA